MIKYKKYLKGVIFATILAPILMIIDAMGAIVQPFFMSKIIDIGIANGDKQYIIKTGITMIIFSIASMMGGFGCMYFSAKAAYGFASNLRKDLLAQIQKFSFVNINKFSTASLVTRITNDVEVLTQLLQMLLRLAIRTPIMFVGGLIMSLILNKQLSVTIVVIIPIIVIGIIILLKKALPFLKILQIKLDKVNSVIRENLIGARVVKAFVREEQQKERFNKANTELKETSIKGMNILIMMMPLVFVIMNLSIVAILWFGSKIGLQGNIQIGALSSFITYIIMTLSSLIMFSMVLMNASRAKISSTRILEVLNENPDIVNKDNLQENLEIEKGDVEYNVKSFSFADSKGEEVLKDISFRVNAGEMIAIIGATGVGKSTLVNLMPRFYDVIDGYVKINGHDVKEYDIHKLRDGIGMVLQENRLFSGTIKENIKWGKNNASDEDIVYVCKVAQIHEYIEGLPDKYDTVVEQRGTNFSGGQKQRLCIARALIKNPSVLIMDDSVSALDSATESSLKSALRNEYKNTTIFMITQRISSCKSADRIIVLEDKTISGIGTHDELINSNKVYKEIYESQQEVNVHE